MVVPMESSGYGNGGSIANVTIRETVQIPPGVMSLESYTKGPWLMEASKCLNKPIHVANSIVTPLNGCVHIRVLKNL